jgi:hypothetical protein
MLIRSYIFTKQTKICIAVTLLHVAKNLVVSPVLLDYIKDMFDGRGITNFLRNGIACNAVRKQLFILYVGRVFIYCLRINTKLFVVRSFYYAKRTCEKSS